MQKTLVTAFLWKIFFLNWKNEMFDTFIILIPLVLIVVSVFKEGYQMGKNDEYYSSLKREYALQDVINELTNRVSLLEKRK